MAAPITFLQTPDGDLDFSQGLRPTPDLETFVAQSLRQACGFWQGEWFLDTREGVPMLKRVLGQKPDIDLLRAVYRKALLAVRGVGQVTRLSVAFDGRTRQLSVFPEVRTAEGDPVPIPGPFLISV